MTKYRQLNLSREQNAISNSTNEDVLKNKFLLGNCFEILSNPQFKHYFDGIFTDIPFKNTIKGKLGEKDFKFENFFKMADYTTKKVSFLISFCNFLNALDLVNFGRQYGWKFHTIIVRDKSPNRTWIHWSHPLRHTEYIIFLKRGKYKL